MHDTLIDTNRRRTFNFEGTKEAEELENKAKKATDPRLRFAFDDDSRIRLQGHFKEKNDPDLALLLSELESLSKLGCLDEDDFSAEIDKIGDKVKKFEQVVWFCASRTTAVFPELVSLEERILKRVEPRLVHLKNDYNKKFDDMQSGIGKITTQISNVDQTLNKAAGEIKSLTQHAENLEERLKKLEKKRD
jgi:hypothetical protein